MRVVTKEEGRVVLEIILYEGRNRQIRKMCEEVGLEVARLKRTAIGSIKLGMLKQGATIPGIAHLVHYSANKPSEEE